MSEFSPAAVPFVGICILFSTELFLNAIVIGILLGGFYAALSIGLSISFGLLDIVNIAHPAFIILGAFACFIFNSHYGFDPILIGIIFAPAFYVLGTLIYRIYYESFEKTGAEALRGLAFFFGVMFIIEVILIMSFGVDFQMVQADYIDFKATFGVVDIPFRMFVPFVIAMIMTFGLQYFSSRTFFGRAMQAVAQDSLALRLMAIDPARIKRIAFGLSLATCSIAGALLVIVIPIEPSVGRLYIGQVFAIVVLGGLGSQSGTLIAAMLLGLVESMITTFFGPSWSPAVAFGGLILVLAFKTTGILGRVGDTRG
ncbi:MAG: branched-chain amino acid ABC transporter permease [Rhodospirillales bacterium]|nr:branched-chain amino acid ABC transporter permease [Rhodospirillales bacterium]